MRNLNKTLIAAAITGLLAVPTANASFDAFYSDANGGSAKFSGSKCKNDNVKKQNVSLSINSGFEGDGPNTGSYFFQMFLFGGQIDGSGPLIRSNKGKTYNQDLTEDGYSDLQFAMSDYVFSNAASCKAPNFYNFDTVIYKFETKVSKNGKKAKTQMDAEGSYQDNDGKNRKVKLKVKANMDLGGLA